MRRDKRGRKTSITKPRYTKRINFLMTPEEHRLLFLVAERCGYRSASEFVRAKIWEEYQRLQQPSASESPASGKREEVVEVRVE